MKRICSFVMVAAVVAAASLASPNTAAAQSRAVARPGTHATGHAVARPAYRYPAYRPSYRYAYPYRGYGYGYPYYGYGYPYYGTSFAFGIGFGFGWGYPYYGYSHYGYPFYYGGYGYPYGGPYPYQYGYYDSGGAARLEVKPREAEVYIDGYLVGTVDNFDGWAQRLNVAPGEHELVIYLKGHRTFRQNVLFRPGATMRVEHVMQPLGPGDTEEPRPVPDRTAGRGPARRDPQDYPPAEDSPRQPGEPVPAPRRGADPPPAQSDQYGSLAVRVQPLDAEVLVDGETWQSPDAGSITLQLSEGVHRVEVRKAGYRTYSAEVRVRRGDSTAVNVSLSRP